MPVKKEAKPAAKKAAAKPAAKPAPKAAAKPAAKPAPKAAAKPAPKAAPKKEEKKSVDFRNYHVSKRAEDGKWQVKYAGGEKAIKLFATQKEAMEYTKKMAENQGGSVLLHNSKGANKGKIKKK